MLNFWRTHDQSSMSHINKCAELVTKNKDKWGNKIKMIAISLDSDLKKAEATSYKNLSWSCIDQYNIYDSNVD